MSGFGGDTEEAMQHTRAACSQDNRPHPHLCQAIKHNIRTMSRLHQDAEQQRCLEDRLADSITRFSGRMLFVYLHSLWFVTWIVLNSGYAAIRPFDPYPYGLLTMIVSLEAIFLSTFVLISQNRISQEADRRADLDLQIGLLIEYELTRTLRMLDTIQDKLDIKNDSDEELQELEQNTRPEEVLREIERQQQQFQLHKQ
jgi:uncharacterized membrane protein